MESQFSLPGHWLEFQLVQTSILNFELHWNHGVIFFSLFLIFWTSSTIFWQIILRTFFLGIIIINLTWERKVYFILLAHESSFSLSHFFPAILRVCVLFCFFLTKSSCVKYTRLSIQYIIFFFYMYPKFETLRTLTRFFNFIFWNKATKVKISFVVFEGKYAFG